MEAWERDLALVLHNGQDMSATREDKIATARRLIALAESEPEKLYSDWEDLKCEIERPLRSRYHEGDEEGNYSYTSYDGVGLDFPKRPAGSPMPPIDMDRDAAKFKRLLLYDDYATLFAKHYAADGLMTIARFKPEVLRYDWAEIAAEVEGEPTVEVLQDSEGTYRRYRGLGRSFPPSPFASVEPQPVVPVAEPAPVPDFTAQLTPEPRLVYRPAVNPRGKKKWVAILLWVFGSLGYLALDRFYLGYPKEGACKLAVLFGAAIISGVGQGIEWTIMVVFAMVINLLLLIWSIKNLVEIIRTPEAEL